MACLQSASSWFWLTVILLIFGEETGWRGFALPLLHRRYGALTAALLLTPIWAVWHVPFFFTVRTYRNFPAAGYVGFVFGLACGSIVLTWLYNRTGGSVLACAVWHGVYNLATGTAAANGTLQAVTSALVYAQAILLVALEARAHRRGEASILGPRRTDDLAMDVVGESGVDRPTVTGLWTSGDGGPTAELLTHDGQRMAGGER